MKKWLFVFLLVPTVACAATLDERISEKKLRRGDLLVQYRVLEGRINSEQAWLEKLKNEIAKNEGELEILTVLKSEEKK